VLGTGITLAVLGKLLYKSNLLLANFRLLN